MATGTTQPTDHSVATSFGDLLRTYRVEAGLSQEELAEKAGLSRRGVSDLERGVRRGPHPATVRHLSQALELDPARELGLTRAARGIPPDTTSDTIGGSASPIAAPTSARVKNDLPLQRTRLIGRENELAHIKQQLVEDGVTLITLTGTGGSGKTRLALELAHQLLDSFKDGVVFVPLASLHDAAWVIPTLAQALGLRDLGNRPLHDIVKDALREKRMLLVLDNFEHVRAAAPSIADLVSSCGQIQVLVTSRAPLGLREEHEFPVSPLATVEPTGHLPAAELGECASVALFTERASAIQPDFALGDDNARAVADVCRRLEGLPLAIELAAARIRVLSPEAMMARLSRRLPFLTSTASDRPARHQTLRATIAWSYDLLSEAEQTLFSRLAVFAGGFELAAAGSIWNRPTADETDVLDSISSLVAHNLVTRDVHLIGEPRFRMLEMIREFGLDGLEQQGDLQSARDGMATWALSMSAAAAPWLRTSEQLTWLHRLEREHDNIRTVLAWARDGVVDPSLGLRVSANVWWFWHHHSYLSEGRRWLEEALAACASDDGADTREALIAVAVMAFNQSDDLAAATYLERALALGREHGDRSTMAQARLYQSVLAVTRDGDLERSSELLAQADDLFGQDGDTWGVAMVRSRQSLVARFRGDHGTSLELAEEALALFRKTGDRFGVGHSLLGLGHTLLDVDQPQAAAEQFMAAIEPLQQIGNTWFISRALAGLASAAIAFGWLELAANVLGCADGLRERIGAPVYGPDRSRYERAREHLSETLERAEFESAYLAGHEALPERMIGAFHSRFER